MKRYVRNIINLSCAKILLTSVISTGNELVKLIRKMFCFRANVGSFDKLPADINERCFCWQLSGSSTGILINY